MNLELIINLPISKSKLERCEKKVTLCQVRWTGPYKCKDVLSGHVKCTQVEHIWFLFFPHLFFRKRKGRFPKQASNWHFLAFPAKYSIALIFFPSKLTFIAYGFFHDYSFEILFKTKMYYLFMGAYKDVIMFFFTHAKTFHDPCAN
jgi:hypothetical protein